MIPQSQQCVEEATIEEEIILPNDEDEQGGDGQEEDNMEEPGIVVIMLDTLTFCWQGDFYSKLCCSFFLPFLRNPFVPEKILNPFWHIYC